MDSLILTSRRLYPSMLNFQTLESVDITIIQKNKKLKYLKKTLKNWLKFKIRNSLKRVVENQWNVLNINKKWGIEIA